MASASHLITLASLIVTVLVAVLVHDAEGQFFTGNSRNRLPKLGKRFNAESLDDLVDDESAKAQLEQLLSDEVDESDYKHQLSQMKRAYWMKLNRPLGKAYGGRVRIERKK